MILARRTEVSRQVEGYIARRSRVGGEATLGAADDEFASRLSLLDRSDLPARKCDPRACVSAPEIVLENHQPRWLLGLRGGI